MHPPVATDHFERSVTGGAAHGARAFCLSKTKLDKNYFFKNQFSPAQTWRKYLFGENLWDICDFSPVLSNHQSEGGRETNKKAADLKTCVL